MHIAYKVLTNYVATYMFVVMTFKRSVSIATTRISDFIKRILFSRRLDMKQQVWVRKFFECAPLHNLL